MAIRFLCFKCGVRVKVPDGTHGRKVRCPGCGASQRVPENGLSTTPAATSPEAPTATPPATPPDPSPETPQKSPVESSTAASPGVSHGGDAPSSVESAEASLEKSAPVSAAPLADSADVTMQELSGDDLIRLLDDPLPTDDDSADTALNGPADAAQKPSAASADESEHPALPWLAVDVEDADDADDADDVAGPDDLDAPSAVSDARDGVARGDEGVRMASAAPQAQAQSHTPTPDLAATSPARQDDPPLQVAGQAGNESLALDATPIAADASLSRVAPALMARQEGVAAHDDATDVDSNVDYGGSFGVASGGERLRAQPPRAIALGASDDASILTGEPRADTMPDIAGVQAHADGAAQADRAQANPLASEPAAAHPSSHVAVVAAALQGASASVQARPMYRGLQATAGLMRLVALGLLVVAVLQGLSWQRGTLPGVLGEAGHKLIYVLQVTLPLGLSAVAWGVAVGLSALRELLRR